MERDQHLSSLLYGICKFFLCFRGPEENVSMIRKKPYLLPLLKNGHSRMTLELNPRKEKFSLLYAILLQSGI